MTDRIHSFLVILAEDTRIDYAQVIGDAVKQLRGVLEVRIANSVANIEHIQAKAQARGELLAALHRVLEDYV